MSGIFRHIINEYFENFVDEVNNMPLRYFSYSSANTFSPSSPLLTRQTNNNFLNPTFMDSLAYGYSYSDTLTQDPMETNDRVITSILNLRRSLQNQEREREMSFGNNVVDLFIDVITNIYDNNAEREFEDVKVVVEPEIFANFKKHTITEDLVDSVKDKDCHVCLSSFSQDETLVTLPCKHFFHEECISNWICKESSKCPVCRQDCRPN